MQAAVEVMSMENRMLNQKEAAIYLGIKEKTLEFYRCRGGGPSYYKPGKRVGYRRSDLDAWLEARKKVC